MFAIARSLFWLTAAYLVIKPGTDLPDPNALSAQAISAGTRVVAEQIHNIECDSLQCMGGKALAVAVISNPPSAAAPMHVEPAANAAPVPRPRPAWMG